MKNKFSYKKTIQTAICLIILCAGLFLLGSCTELTDGQGLLLAHPDVVVINVDCEETAVLREQAEQDNVSAQFELAFMYASAGDINMYVYWLTRAAEQGNAFAQHNLGVIHFESMGVLQNYEKAEYWFRRAAEQTVSTSYFYLGLMYHSGLGVEQDFESALYWYRKAIEHDVVAAKTNLGIMYDEGLGVPQSYEWSAYWFRKAAEQGDAIAQNNLGVAYRDGEGMPQDYEQAAYWFRRAITQGDTQAQANLLNVPAQYR